MMARASRSGRVCSNPPDSTHGASATLVCCECCGVLASNVGVPYLLSSARRSVSNLVVHASGAALFSTGNDGPNGARVERAAVDVRTAEWLAGSKAYVELLQMALQIASLTQLQHSSKRGVVHLNTPHDMLHLHRATNSCRMHGGVDVRFLELANSGHTCHTSPSCRLSTCISGLIAAIDQGQTDQS